LIKVGESKSVKVNIRLIAATNRDLQNEIAVGHFRQDLFYRIAVFQIALPPLRERVIDIEELANYFAKIVAAKTNKKIKPISKEIIEILKQHQWNGNIRELKNVMERAVILMNDDELNTENLPFELQQASASPKQLSAFDLASAEKIHIQKVLNYTNGNKTETAKLLNIALTTLYRKIEEYKL
jgi:two-component system, NtrC family, response regulator